MAKNRIALWDNVKFFAITSVVVGHLIQPYLIKSDVFRALVLFIWSFHMPLFIFVSGLFHKNIRIKEKMVSYFSLYFVLKIMLFIVDMIRGKGYELTLFSDGRIPWFMFAMACFTGLTYLLRDINPKYVLAVSVIIALFSGYDDTVGDFFALSRIIVFFPLYYLGTVVNRESIENLAKKKIWKVSGAVILLIWLIICFCFTDDVYVLKSLFTGRNSFNDAILPYGFLMRLAAYFVSAVTGFAFILATPTFSVGKLTVFGQRTLQIYFWHNVITKVLVSAEVYPDYFSNSPVGKLLWILLGVLITVVLSLNIFRYPSHWLLNCVRKDNSNK